MPEPLHLERPRAQATATGSRVTARVAGSDVWFESPDLTLRPSIEGFVAAFLIPSLELRRPLVVAGHACPEFVANTRQVVEQAHQWRRSSRMLPSYGAALGAVPGGRTPRAALFLSGGVASFHSLLSSGRHVDDLVLVQGFDVPLTDARGAASCDQLLREVAEATGTRAILVRSNLRTHPVFRQVPWERGHGGALAAVGHVLADHVTAALISSSHRRGRRGARRSHWPLERSWSSASLRLERVGAELTREQQLSAIAQHPVVRQHLRVCGLHHRLGLNCSRCEKCLRTQLGLLGDGQLAHYRKFEGETTLAERLDRLESVADPVLFPIYQRMIARPMRPDVAAAGARLLERSRAARRTARRRKLFGRVSRAARRVWPVWRGTAARHA